MDTLRINDVFWTFQGEGMHAGRRALFVRLPFCNYNCPWCDTEYNSYKEWDVVDLVDFAEKEKSRFVVITGGEPLMNKQTPGLIKLFKTLGFYVAVETNGSMPALEGIDFITCSPKKYVQKGLPEFFINPAIRQKVSEYKYVIEEGFDLNLLSRHDNDEDDVLLSLSPEFNKFDDNLKTIFEYIKENPRWKISLQTHKWMKVP